MWRILQQGRLDICSCLCQGVSYCEHLQVMFVTSEMLPGTQQRRVYPNWALHCVLFSNCRTDYLAIPSENKENCAVPVEE